MNVFGSFYKPATKNIISVYRTATSDDASGSNYSVGAASSKQSIFGTATDITAVGSAYHRGSHK